MPSSSTRSASPRSTRSPAGGQPEREPREHLPVAERRRRRQRLALVRLDEAPSPPAERRRAPGRTTRRRGTAPLRAPARRRTPPSACAHRPRSPAARVARSRTGRPRPPAAPRAAAGAPAPTNGSSAEPCGAPLGHRGRLRRPNASQAAAAVGERLGGRRAARRPQRLELVGRQLAEAPEPGLPRERVDDDQLRRATEPGRARARRAAGAGRRGRARTRARRCAPSRNASSSCRSRRSSEDRIARRLPQPHSDRNAARARRSSGRANSRHRPLVQHVLPRQHRAAEPRLPQRVARALAVRDVQERRRRRRLAAAAGQVRGAARAVVERVARAADDARELLAHPPQPGDPPVDLVDLRRHPHAQRLRGRRVRRAAPRYSPISASVKPTACASLIARRNRTVSSSYRRCPLGFRSGAGKQPPALVVAQRLDVHARPRCDLADPHPTDYRPVPRYGNQTPRAPIATLARVAPHRRDG